MSDGMERLFLWILNAVWAIAVLLGRALIGDMQREIRDLRRGGERLARVETQNAEVERRLGSIDLKLDKLLEERR